MNGNDIKVSIIVPVFNVCRYLEECLDSILNQSLKEIEIICGDGGSNDGSLEILRKYEGKDSRVKVISKDKSGYGQSMNDCFAIAKGKYIGIVESDDVVRSTMFERLYDIAERYGLDWVRSDIYFYYSMLEVNNRLRRESIIYDGGFYNEVLNPQEDYRPFKSGLRTWSGIYNTEFLRKNDIKHHETPGGSYQDVGFYLKTLYYATRVMFIDEAFYMWRQDNPGSSVHYDSRKLVDKSLYEWDLNKKYLKEKKLGKRAWGSYRYRQFFSFRWTLEMAKGPDVERVLNKFRKEFKHAVKNDEIDRAFFNDYEWGLLSDFLRENRIDIPRLSVEHRHEDVGRCLVTAWMKFAGRIIRPYKNYIRRIVDSSNEELQQRIIDQNNDAINRIMNRLNDMGHEQALYYRGYQEGLLKLETNLKSELVEVVSLYDDGMNGIKKQLVEILEENANGQKELKNQIKDDIRCVLHDLVKIPSTQEQILKEIGDTRHRVEDVYNNIDKYVIEPKYGADERTKMEVNSILELLISGDKEYNKRICGKYLKFIEIETFSKCNRQCWFCPNNYIDRHSGNTYLPEEIYLKVLSELKDIEFAGTISFSRYNEPLSDRIILTRIAQARKYCPNAYLRSNTNGDYLTRSYLEELSQAGLDELEIQLYIDEQEVLSMDKFVTALTDYSARIGINNYKILETPYDRFTAIFDYPGMKVTYMALDMKTVANNRGETLNCVSSFTRKTNCLVPFKNLYLDYTGKYMMCCNVRSDEPRHEKYICGDAKEQSVYEVFMGEKLIDVRKRVGRKTSIAPPCSSCKYFTLDNAII